MKSLVTYTISVLCFCFLAVHGQPTLKWLNRTGTNNDRVFDSRIILTAEYLYHPLTAYEYFNYVEWSEDHAVPRQLNEFEKHRLQESQKGFQSLISKYWQTGFLIELPLQAEGQSETPSILSVGKYDFSSQTFPLYLKVVSLDYPVDPDNILFDRLLKEVKGIKEPKFTELNGAFLHLTPYAVPFSQVAMQVPSSFAEEFKRLVINHKFQIYLLGDCDAQPSRTFTSPKFTKQFDKQKEALGYSRSPQRAKEQYSQIHGKPIEFFHMLDLRFTLKGFRIVDQNEAILFEWIANDALAGKWADTTDLASGNSLQVDEKQTDPSLVRDTDVSWKKETIITSFRFDPAPVTNGQFQSFLKEDSYICLGKWGTPLTVWKSDNGIMDKTTLDPSEIPPDAFATRVAWNDCDFYLKRHGKRLPKLLEWQEAFLKYPHSKMFDLKVFDMDFEEICFDPIISERKNATIGARMKAGGVQWFGAGLQQGRSSARAGFRGFFR